MLSKIISGLVLTATTTLATTGAVLTVQPQSATAATFTTVVGGVSYEVESVRGTFYDFIGSANDIQQQPWWGSSDTARSFALAYAPYLDTSNPSAASPYFGYDAARVPVFAFYAVSAWRTAVRNGAIVVESGGTYGRNNYDWAVVPGAATPYTIVPTPALLPGLIGMGIAAYRKRKAASANV